MAQWRVSGADKANGKDRTETVEAPDQRQATIAGAGMGILIEKVIPLPPPADPEMEERRSTLALAVRRRQPGELSTFISLLSILLIVLGCGCMFVAFIDAANKDSAATAWHSVLFGFLFWIVGLLLRISSRLAGIAERR